MPWDCQPALLYVAGHAPKRGGYVLAVEYGDDVRAVVNRRRAFQLVERFNRMQWRKWHRTHGSQT